MEPKRKPTRELWLQDGSVHITMHYEKDSATLQERMLEILKKHTVKRNKNRKNQQYLI